MIVKARGLLLYQCLAAVPTKCNSTWMVIITQLAHTPLPPAMRLKTDLILITSNVSEDQSVDSTHSKNVYVIHAQDQLID